MTDSVLVVGAGIAGLGLARGLALRGVPCTVLERLVAPPDAGLGPNLPANGVRVLAALRVVDEVRRVGVQVRRREYRNQSGRLLFAVDEEAFWGDVGPTICLRRAALLDILRTVVAPENVRWGCGVVSAEQTDHSVIVHMESGPSEEYAYVVGADGVHSAVRAAVTGEDARPSAMTAASWRFMVANPGVDCWTAWSGSAATLLLIPVDGETVYGYASTTRGGAAGDDPQWVATTFSAFPEPVRRAVGAALTDPSQLFYSAVSEVYAERWSRHRITLIGDAAHAMGPIWAQGAALALEDSLVLAALLSDGSDWAVVGTEFERLRRARVERVQAATDRMSRLAGLPLWLRDLAGPALGPKAYRAAYGPLRAPVQPPVGGKA